jgi:hypothetical protein
VNGRVSTQVVVEDDASASVRHVTVVALSWSDSDPLAVEIALTSQPNHPSLPAGRWVVLRDFLRYGCSEPTGDGDVRISPVEDSRIRLDLTTHSRPHIVHLPAFVLRAFLDETEQVVPTGHEAGDEVIDELIRRLLDYTD